MSIERELLERVLVGDDDGDLFLSNILYKEIEELLAQPEHIVDVTDMVEQEPVAWITEWVQRYRHNDTPIMDSAVSFTKGGAPAVPNPNYIPLYTAPPKREPLSSIKILELTSKHEYAINLIRAVEKAHGIGVNDE